MIGGAASVAFAPASNRGTSGAGGDGFISISFVAAPPSEAVEPPHSYFTFRLPDGQECTAISPIEVVNGISVALPGSDANCVSPGAQLVGWSIPGQTRVFAPGSEVMPVDSQVFTAVLVMPIVTVELDANVAEADKCLDAAGTDLVETDRLTSLYLRRPGMDESEASTRPALDSFPTPNSIPCTPLGSKLAAWNTAGDGSGTTIDIGSPLTPIVSATESTVRLYAIWRVGS